MFPADRTPKRPRSSEADREKVRRFMQKKREASKESLRRQQREIEAKKEAVKERLLALEMTRRETYVRYRKKNERGRCLHESFSIFLGMK